MASSPDGKHAEDKRTDKSTSLASPSSSLPSSSSSSCSCHLSRTSVVLAIGVILIAVIASFSPGDSSSSSSSSIGLRAGAFIWKNASVVHFFFRGVFAQLLEWQSAETQRPSSTRSPLPQVSIPVIWYAPFLSGGGYCSEATSFAMGLRQITKVQAVHHGDSYRESYVDGLDEDTYQAMYRMTNLERIAPTSGVVVCHSEPGAWHPARYQTSRCPPEGSLYTVGRTMFETDRLPKGWAERINKLNESWVPTEFHRKVFEEGGVDPTKLRVVGEPVDTSFYDPARQDLECHNFSNLKPPPQHRLPQPGKSSKAGGGEEGESGEQSESGSSSEEDISPESSIGQDHKQGKERLEEEEKEEEEIGGGGGKGEAYKFLSVFKWEDRKGWRVLLEAYMREFTAQDSVALYILTNAYHTSSDFDRKIKEFVESIPDLSASLRGGGEGRARGGETTHIAASGLPRVELLTSGIPTRHMPCLYKSVDAFVLPSRGEGWGRPHVEAMSMGLPVIATNWSGTTEFMTEQNSYPLRIDGLVAIEDGPFKGHEWANPSIEHLRTLLRHVVENPEEAREKGMKAREDMESKYCMECLNRVIIRRLHEIEKKVNDSRKSG